MSIGTGNAMAEMHGAHFTIKELSAKWHISESTLLRIFSDEPDIIRIGNLNSKRRTKISVRIPEDVAVRVYLRLRNQRKVA
jgi:AraC-like DNA-binding protein